MPGVMLDGDAGDGVVASLLVAGPTTPRRPAAAPGVDTVAGAAVLPTHAPVVITMETPSQNNARIMS